MTKKEVLVLGAGVTGLQTALTLLQSNNYAVTILAAHFPGVFDISYTSPWAGGNWRSFATPDQKDIARFDSETYQYWTRLLSEKSESELGLGFKPEVIYWTNPEDKEIINGGENIWWKEVVQDFEIIPEEKCTVGKAGLKYKGICINVPRYLDFLVEEVKRLGVKLVEGKVRTEGGITGVLSSARDLLNDKGLEKESTFEIFINATGLWAKAFVSAKEAEKLFPVRGQTILVEGECPVGRTLVGVDEDPTNTETIYIIPRPASGTTVLGGCMQPGNWSADEDVGLTKRILRRNKVLAPELLIDGEFKVIDVRVGLRPGRIGGPRVEEEVVDGVKVVHSYGHGGAGYQNSIGSARKVLMILEGDHE